MHATAIAWVLVFCSCTVTTVAAQPVYRCEVGGKVHYTHEPCLGAQAIDTTPTQGLDTWTGKTKRHSEVQRDMWQRDFAHAVRPLTGQTPEAFKLSVKRQKLSTVDQLHCQRLDHRLPELEQAAASAPAARKAHAEQALYAARLQFRDLRC